MRKYPILLLWCLFALGISAQSFEGTIRYRMSTVVTDPQKKKEMEVAAQEMTPEKIAGMISEIEKQMQTPEMKKMLTENPQLKATIEKQLGQLRAMEARAAAEKSDPLPAGAMGMTMIIKGYNVLTKMEGMLGAMTGDILYRGAEQKTYQLFPESKTYSEFATDEESISEAGEFKVTPTSDFQTILGYRCRKYLIQLNGETNQTGELWAANELKLPKGIWKGNVANLKGLTEVEGLPMRMTMQISGNEGAMLMEVTELKKMSLPDSTFEIPKGFTKE